MIVYTKHCLPCTHKAESKALTRLAHEHKLDYEVRQVTYSKEWQTQAANLAKYHKVEYPFVHHDGKAVHISDYESLFATESQDEEQSDDEE